MNPKDWLKKYGINVDADLILNIIMLLIPGIRFFGAFWMYSRIQRKYGFMGIKKFALFIVTLLVATGTIAEVLTDVIWPLSIAALVGAFAFIYNSRERDKLSSLHAYLIGRDSCSIEQLCDALKIKRSRLEGYINKLKKMGRLPATTYIDKARDVLVLTPDGRKDEGRYRATESKAAPDAEAQSGEEAEHIRERSKYDKILYQIRYINEQIDDKEMSEKIYHIENTTANIFHLVEQKPERAGEIQTFMEYYLPTTMNLLYKYSQLEKQGDIESENIKTAKRNIEGIMDKLVEGFDTQLDKLFKSDAIDITNDVKVLEKMMQMEHLNR